MTNPERAASTFSLRTIDELVLEDERSFRHVALYTQLKELLLRAKYGFRVLREGSSGRRDRALFLNLTFWSADQGGDVLADDHLDADVVAHVAWHHLAAKHLHHADKKPSVAALFFGEAIASAFDVYLVGRLLGHAPQSSFLETQVPAMFDAASAAGLSEDDFEALLGGIAADPDRAFEDLRALLFDAMNALYAARSADEAIATLSRFDAHRFAPLLHHYELSNWVLYARAYGEDRADAGVAEVDTVLRKADSALDWLETQWVGVA